LGGGGNMGINTWNMTILAIDTPYISGRRFIKTLLNQLH